MLFTFAGSTHSNYVNYILETIMNLELESSPGLKVALLRRLIWNLTGIDGHCEEGDFIVEYFNRLLEDVVQHKTSMVGMKQKASRHCDPHANPKILILLKVYRETELHSRRLGRQIDDQDTDNFVKGVKKKLRDGRLQTALARLAASRQVFHSDEPTPTPTSEPMVVPDDDAGLDSEEEDTSSDSESASESNEDLDEPTVQNFYATRGSTYILDGELVLD
ncbi:hypothetical protein C8R46DRAFT_807903, partial [Mycena filopes]